MAAFINNDITAAGLLVLAKGVAGQQINYTKIVLGDGYLEEGSDAPSSPAWSARRRPSTSPNAS